MKNFKKLVFGLFIFILSVCSIVSLVKTNKNVVFAENDFDVPEYCLLDANTGKVLIEKNSTEKREVASMVKLMTSLLTMEKIENGEWTLDTELLVSDYAASMEGSQAFLDAGKTYKVDAFKQSINFICFTSI